MTYSDFVAFLFDHPEVGPEWYHAPDFTPPDLGAQTAVRYTTELFRKIDVDTAKFSEEQICSGLEYLVNPACGDHVYALLNPSVDEAGRIDVLASMHDVFSKLFEKRCSNSLSAGVMAPVRPYNGVCYMWWDVFPRHGVPPEPATDRVILETLVKILTLDSKACRESALHGLGHWQLAYPEFVENAIDEAEASIPADLKQYAALARRGYLQ